MNTQDRVRAVKLELRFGLGLFPRWSVRDADLAWHAMRDEVMAEHLEELPGTRPLSWWMREAPEPLGDDESQFDYLARLGLLTEDERDARSFQPCNTFS